LTYTVVIKNTGTIDGTSVVFTDPPPPGTSFVPNSLKLNTVVQSGADPATGVPIGTVPKNGGTVTVEFKVQVTSVPPSARYDNAAMWTYQYQSCTGQPIQNGTFTTNTASTTIPLIDGSKSVSPTAATPNDILTYTITIPNTGTANAAGVTLADPIPSGTTYVAGSTTLNGTAVPDVSGAMPFATGREVHSPGE